MGYNGTMLDCELPKKIKKKPVFCDEEVRIQHIVDNKLPNKAGGLCKTGLIVANCRVVVVVGKKMAELEKRQRQRRNRRTTPSRISGVVMLARLMLIGYWRGDRWT